jgi:division protein CdvB (Snf7/Vps24/ESCRT-III family)
VADAEILQGEIENLQEAVLEVDQRLDAAEAQPTTNGEADIHQCLGRIEATQQSILTRLDQLEQRTESQLETVSEQVEEATTAAETAAEVAAVSALMAVEAESEAAPEEAVIEVEPAPEPTPETEESRPRSPSFWERALGGR